MVAKVYSMLKRGIKFTPDGIILLALVVGLVLVEVIATVAAGLPPPELKKEPSKPKIYYVGHGVTAPVVIENSQPTPLEEASSPKVKVPRVVLVEIVIAPDGTVNRAKVWHEDDKSLADVAVRTVKTWKFKPAMRDGTPVWCRLMVEITFKLK
jgi:TonB family protein